MTATVLNDAGKVTKIYSKDIINPFQFPVISEDRVNTYKLRGGKL